MDHYTIIAQCTPRGPGALALLRLSGPQALIIATQIGRVASQQPICDLPSHTIHFGKIVNKQHEIIDQVMFFIMHAPRSFTGEHTVEISTHNNPFIIESVIAEAISYGAHIAQGGEFSKRAMLNGKIDLIEAEAINELIHANTQLALKQSLAQIQGSFSSWTKEIEQQLIQAMAYCQASFEFIEEENMSLAPEITAILKHIVSTIAQLKISFNQQQRIRQGIRIAIIGSVNAGKSSLFNHLLKQNRAIVTNIAGTTRDVIEAGVYKNQNYWTLIDTAGLRQTDDIIEQEGIKRSFNEARLADIVLVIIDASREMSNNEEVVYNQIITEQHNKSILIYNKNDLPRKTTFNKDGYYISTQDESSCIFIEGLIETKIKELLQAIPCPFLLNQRQHNLLLSLEQQCNAILQSFAQESIAYEIVSLHLQEAAAHLAELTGKSISELAMDQVFRSFCVGK